MRDKTHAAKEAVAAWLQDAGEHWLKQDRHPAWDNQRLDYCEEHGMSHGPFGMTAHCLFQLAKVAREGKIPAQTDRVSTIEKEVK